MVLPLICFLQDNFFLLPSILCVFKLVSGDLWLFPFSSVNQKKLIKHTKGKVPENTIYPTHYV